MWSLSKLLFTLCLLIIPSTLLLSSPGGPSLVVRAQEDIIEEDEILEDDEATVENEDDVLEEEGAAVTAGEGEEEEEESKPLKPSADADTFLLFTKPASSTELPAGRVVKILVGFQNKGDKDFVVDSLEASFRYPQDYSYYIQNFTTAQYEQLVEPNQEVSFSYMFMPSETFSSRPFGLSILLHYKDQENNFYMDALFNDTVSIVEIEDGLDGETFFLYLLMAALLVLLVVGIHQALTHTSLRKKLPVGKKSKPVIEMGTQNNSDVDFDWIPMDHVTGYKSSPHRSPKNSSSPKNRRKRNAGAED